MLLALELGYDGFRMTMGEVAKLVGVPGASSATLRQAQD